MKIGLFIDEDRGRPRVIKSLKEQFKDLKPSYKDDVCVGSTFIDNMYDLCVVDYGGLTSIPGNSLGEHYARYVNKYAEDHPNTLIVYITVMGSNYLESEGLNLEELHNIRWCNYDDVRLLWNRWIKGELK
jgi:hypothetical protein